ncbi:methyl-accepting chemotaxis protein [Aidingimonas lacisalsi]|uniref:methyl-accepting chemotaxis protein n=1 Tax=Aidingimonas lacisalsi TaxID=2604086 RepID=UPI0011D1B67A|nr:methyl-accepting chemotaxis protein [Aidingimonas lacisalsi]
MKRSLSLRAMLIGLFLAAVVGVVVLAATGWTSNQRLIESQRFITNDIMPQQDASRAMNEVLGAFDQRHASLVSAESVAELDDVTSRETLLARFESAEQQLSDYLAADQRARLDELEEGKSTLMAADDALESVRRDHIGLASTMEARIEDMQSMIREVMVSAEDMSGRAALAEVRDQREISAQVDDLRDSGLSLVPESILAELLDGRVNVAQISGDVQTSVALLADLGRRLMQVDSADALVNLRYNEVAQQINSTQQALAQIATASHANQAQVERAETLAAVLDDLDELMVSGDDSVYALRQRQLELSGEETEALAAVETAADGMRDALGAVQTHTVQAADDAAAQAQELANAGRYLLIIVTLAVIMVLAVFGWRTMVRVLGPLAQMRRQMENISGQAGENSDLTMRLELERDDEIGRTAQAFNQMMGTFERIVAKIREGAGNIAANSRQITTGNDDLSQRTEEQSSSLAETASSLEEITATVKQTADYAHQARDASSEVDQRAHSAGEVAERTNTAMAEIRDSSEKISTIVSAIDDIAFQTNLLALNASVEAARAGEQGRGFAVVAAEVRKLAQRSADEAGKIRALVGDSVDKVGEGAKLVESTSTHLQEIIHSLESVSRYVGEIADATQEQSSGIEEINRAVAQLDQVTQQNASLVQEASSASHSLDHQAAEMNDLVSRFRVSEQYAHSPDLMALLHLDTHKTPSR